MAQAARKKLFEKNCVDVEKVISEMRVKQDDIAQIIKIDKKSVKSQVLSLSKKSNLNARYFEDLIPIEKAKQFEYWRNYGIF